MDFRLVHWRFCFCKKVRIELAEWLSDPILNNNAVRVSENIILPGGSTEENKHFNYHGVQCPLYLCCSRIGRDDLLWKVEKNLHALKFVHRLPRETLMSIWETLRWLPIPATSTTYVTEFLSTRQISLFPLKFDFWGGLKALYIVKPSSVTRRNIMDGMGNGLGIVYTPHQCWYSARKSPY